MNELMSIIREAIDQVKPMKITLAKPKEKSNALRNIFFRPIILNDVVVYQATFRYETKDETKNFEVEKLIESLENYLIDHFYNADILMPEVKYSFVQSKKGKTKIFTKKEKHDITINHHNKEKKRLISPSTPFLKDLGISSSHGNIYGHAQDKFKQINRYIELISGLIKEDPIRTIYDMGSGKGYLTFALYSYLFPQNGGNVIGIEIRPDLVQKCNGIAEKNGFKNLRFELGSIDSFSIGSADMVIALHACDIATDMAIAKGLSAKAKFIVMAPCCHKQIRREMKTTDSALSPLLRHGILKERQAEMITDSIRALLLESRGYAVQVFEFISSDHTGKNVMITAIYTGKKDLSALEKIAKLKTEFGITEHYLEKLIVQL